MKNEHAGKSLPFVGRQGVGGFPDRVQCTTGVKYDSQTAILRTEQPLS